MAMKELIKLKLGGVGSAERLSSLSEVSWSYADKGVSWDWGECFLPRESSAEAPRLPGTAGRAV